MTQIKFVKEIPIINGTYKKDTPNKEIGYQKWRVRKTYEVDIEYEIVTKTREEAVMGKIFKQGTASVIPALKEYYGINFNIPLDTDVKMGYDWLNIKEVKYDTN